MTAAHEPRRAPGAHLSDDELSEAAEGRQEGAEGGTEHAQNIGSHLRDCLECQARVDAMAELLNALADLVPPAMPTHVAQRIDAALAEAARTTTTSATDAEPRTAAHDTPDASSDGSAGPDSPLRPASELPQTRRRAEGLMLPDITRRPPSPHPETRRPGSNRPPNRRTLRHTVGWVLASVVFLGGVAGLATALLSSSQTTSGASASGASGQSHGNAKNPVLTAPERTKSYDSTTSLAQLSIWTRATLTAATSEEPAASPGAHPNALTNAPLSPADAAAIAQCRANPDRVGRPVLGTAYGVFLGEPAVLVIYAIANSPQSVDSVAYQVPCASNNYRVLAEEVVNK